MREVVVKDLSLLTKKCDMDRLLEGLDVRSTKFISKKNGLFDRRCLVELGSHEAHGLALARTGRLSLDRRVNIVVDDGSEGAPRQEVGKFFVHVSGFNKDQLQYDAWHSLEKHFACCGNIVKIKIGKEVAGPIIRLTGFAKVVFSTKEDAEKAIGLDHSPLGEVVDVVAQWQMEDTTQDMDMVDVDSCDDETLMDFEDLMEED